MLIPELYVERGQTYTFVVEGGDLPAISAQYHPLYITDSPEGGIGQKTEEEQQKEKYYAGVERDTSGDYLEPTAGEFIIMVLNLCELYLDICLIASVGRYCEWRHKTIDMSAISETFEEYVKTLYLDCEDGDPGYLNWTVPMDAPDTLYYQVLKA